MLSATEFYPTGTLLNTVLWIEAVIYLGIGAYELFDDFFEKPKPWMRLNDRMNGWIMFQHKVGHKMHAGLCFLLGFVALNGAIEGMVTRFELELIFISFAVIMPVLWSTFLPGKLGVIVILTKPEFWLQSIMFVYFSDLIRLEVLLLCIGLNLWGVIVYFLHTRKNYFSPYTYQSLRRDAAEAEGEARVKQLDRVAMYNDKETSTTQE